GHRPVRIERDAEVTSGEISDEITVLDRQRPVEMQPLAQRLDLLDRCVGPERDPRRITGDHPGDGEDQHGNADQNDQRDSQPLQYEAEHRRHDSLSRSCGPGRRQAPPGPGLLGYSSATSMSRNEKPIPSRPKALSGSLRAGALTRSEAAKIDCLSKA